MKTQLIEILLNDELLIAKLDSLNTKLDTSIANQKDILERIENIQLVAPPVTEVPVEPAPVEPIPEVPIFPPTPEVPVESPIIEQPVDSVSILDYGIEPIDSQVGSLPFRGCLYDLKKKESGDGYWVLYGAEPKILKVINGIESTEIAKSWIGRPEFNDLNLSEVDVYFPKGTYILLQGNGVNPFWYQKTKSITGYDAVLIGIMNENYPVFCRICPRVEGIELKNIVMDFTPDWNRDIILDDTTISLDDIQTSINPITGISSEASIDLLNINIESKARIRAGVFIDSAKDVSVIDCNISSKYADNGIRISKVLGDCNIIGNKTGEGFNTGIQASSHREGLSLNYNIQSNHIVGVLEESLGYDSYANNIGLVPVIVTSKISNVGVDYVDLDSLYFIDEIQANVSYGKREVDVSFVGDATRFLLVVQSGELEYKTFDIDKYEVVNAGKTIRIYSTGIDSKLLRSDVSVCSGFKGCVMQDNQIDGFIPESGQPAHGISLWGGGFYNIVKNNVVSGSKNGLQLASLGAFGVDGFFCHAIGNIVEGNQFLNCYSAIRVTSEYSDKLGSGNKLLFNKVVGGDVVINNQLDFEMIGNEFTNNSIFIEHVSGVFSGGELVDSIVTVKNCPDLKVEDIKLTGNSAINYI